MIGCVGEMLPDRCQLRIPPHCLMNVSYPSCILGRQRVDAKGRTAPVVGDYAGVVKEEEADLRSALLRKADAIVTPHAGGLYLPLAA
jgi:hypothetical protein